MHRQNTYPNEMQNGTFYTRLCRQKGAAFVPAIQWDQRRDAHLSRPLIRSALKLLLPLLQLAAGLQCLIQLLLQLSSTLRGSVCLLLQAP